MMKELSLKELEILKFIKEKIRTISDVSKGLKIDYKNAHRYCTKLNDLDLIRIEPLSKLRKKGKPVKLIFNDDEQVQEYMYIILKEIKKLGGEISFTKFMELPKPLKQDSNNLSQIVKAKSFLSMHFSPYLKEIRKLTPEGEKFLKKFSKKQKPFP